jgi:hypothetical protein
MRQACSGVDGLGNPINPDPLKIHSFSKHDLIGTSFRIRNSDADQIDTLPQPRFITMAITAAAKARSDVLRNIAGNPMTSA